MKLLSDGPDVHYLVRQDPDEIRERLAAAVDVEEFFFSGDREFVGHVGPRTFRFRRESGFRNSFRPYLYGRVEPDLHGSRIVVRLGLPAITRFFMVAWLGGMLVISLVVLVLFLTGNLATTLYGPGPRMILIIPPAMFSAGVAVAGIGRLRGRGDERRLLQFADELWGPRVDPDYSRSR